MHDNRVGPLKRSNPYTEHLSEEEIESSKMPRKDTPPTLEKLSEKQSIFYGLANKILLNQHLLNGRLSSIENGLKEHVDRLEMKIDRIESRIHQMYDEFLLNNPTVTPVLSIEEESTPDEPFICLELQEIFKDCNIPKGEISLIENHEDFQKKLSKEAARIKSQSIAQGEKIDTAYLDNTELPGLVSKDYFVMNMIKGEDVAGYIKYEPINGKNVNIFSIFDGHGGAQASTFCQDNLKSSLDKTLPLLVTTNEDFEYANALIMAFVLLDARFRKYREEEKFPLNPGCTGIAAFIIENKLFIANCGDSRAILVQEELTDSCALSCDYKASNDYAQKSVTKRGGICFPDIHNIMRVDGSLAITRAMGDEYLRKQVEGKGLIKPITPRPRIMMTELDLVKNENLFLVLCSDGLTDVMNTDTIIKTVHDLRGSKSAVEIGTTLIKEARRLKAHDDITVGVINLVELSRKTSI